MSIPDIQCLALQGLRLLGPERVRITPLGKKKHEVDGAGAEDGCRETGGYLAPGHTSFFSCL